MVCFFFNDTATTEIYTLSLHDALPISGKLCFFFCLCLASVFLCFATCNWFCFGRSASLCSHLLAMLLYLLWKSGPIYRPFPAASTPPRTPDRKSTRLNSSHANISYAVF